MKDNLIKLLCKAPLGFKTFEDQYYKSTISKVADYLIANDVQIVRHGKWLRNVLFNGTHTCSLCNSDPIHYDGATGYVEILSEYCPHCGAKMDLEE